MAEKRKYTDVVVSLETKFTYIETHLKNIDAHLARQNDRLLGHETRITRNATNNTWIIRIGGGLFGGGGGIALILKLFGVY